MKTNIIINNLKVQCILGVSDEERKSAQEILVTIKLSVDAKKASISDKLDDAINYSEIYNKILSHVKHSKFHLLEALGKSIGSICLEFSNAQKVKVTITKPKILKNTEGVSIEIEMDKNYE